MIILQRASAGSGKTYTLARTYIFNLLTYNGDDGRLHLRPRIALRDALRSILAVTFTNKATQEMKVRILDKLFMLTSDLPVEKVDYLAELLESVKDTDGNPVQRKDIAAAAHAALSLMLNDYSAFNISTIDAFFQLVLRTFAYETDLNFNYQLEIESENVARMGLEQLLGGINNAHPDPIVKRSSDWLRRFMENNARDEKKWNVFVRDSRHSPYHTLLSEARNLDSENFKNIKADLDSYFSRHPDYYNIIHSLDERFDGKARGIKKLIRRHSTRILAAMNSCGIEQIKNGNKLLSKQLKDAYMDPCSFKDFDLDKFKTVPADAVLPDDQRIAMASDLEEIRKHVEEYTSLVGSEGFRLWQACSETLPWLQLILNISLMARQYLTENNAFQLSDTNTMLERIIGDDSAPYIYERLGTRLQHYLIDEFQDTSALQWRNLRPLVGESVSQGHSNLIIGDAKQSIYRFRNADSTLITQGVQQDFPNDVIPRGMDVADNTNHRSLRNIVEFNNFLFQYLAEIADDTIGKPNRPSDVSFANLYSNVVQHPRHTAYSGFVQLSFYPNDPSGSMDNDDEKSPAYFADIPELISSLLERGYHQNDIAVLVRGRKAGRQVVAALRRYNNLDTTTRPIDFVSEDSLLLQSSPGVRTIDSILRAISEGGQEWDNNASIAAETGDHVHSRPRNINWRNISSDFNVFAQSNPGMPRGEMLEKFISENSCQDNITQLLHDLPTLALPALVEGIIERFIPEAIRRAEAPFIAAFQDLVLDYCGCYPADLASFLRFWDTKKENATINSPEGCDAVQVLTIHKAKGLEYKCVILPEKAGQIGLETLCNGKEEWVWVESGRMQRHTPDIELPPYFPIAINNKLPKYDAYNDECAKTDRMLCQDQLNTLYVGYTRAVNELYIMQPLSGKGDSWSKKILSAFIPEDDSCDAPMTITYGNADMPDPALLEVITADPDQYGPRHIIRYGQPVTDPGSDTRLPILNGIERVEKHLVEDYQVRLENCMLTFRPASDDSAHDMGPAPDCYDDDPDDDDANPRAYGTLMHTIMEDIHTTSDLERAIRRMRVRGIMSREMLRDARSLLEEAMRRPEVSHWFDGSMARVDNERDLLRGGAGMLRPDRVMTRSDGGIVIVDYKFGLSHTPDTRRRHLRQVEQYARTLRLAGEKNQISPFVWYVRLNEVMAGETLPKA